MIRGRKAKRLQTPNCYKPCMCLIRVCDCHRAPDTIADAQLPISLTCVLYVPLTAIENPKRLQTPNY